MEEGLWRRNHVEQFIDTARCIQINANHIFPSFFMKKLNAGGCSKKTTRSNGKKTRNEATLKCHESTWLTTRLAFAMPLSLVALESAPP